MDRLSSVMADWLARSIGVHAEMAHVSSIPDRIEILRNARSRCFGKIRVSGFCCLVSFFVMVAGLIILDRYGDLFRNVRRWYFAHFVFFIVLTILLHFLTCRRQLQGLIRKDLVRRGIPVCVRCGYDRTGSAGKRCPECGEPPLIS